MEQYEKGGIAEVDELLKKYNKATVEELVAYLDKEIASLTTVKDELTKSLEESKKLAETAQVEATTAKEELNKKLEAEKATLIKTRRDELGEFAKDISDEDILNDVKYLHLLIS